MTTDRRSFLQASLNGLAALTSVSVLGGLEGCQQLPSRVASGSTTARKTALPTEKLADRVTLVTGAPGNVVALSSSDGILLVDSGSSALARAVRASLGGAPVRTLFNTHYHTEQTGGNELFGTAGTEIHAHLITRQWLATDYYVPAEDRWVKALPKKALPTVTFREKGAMKAGAESIEFGYWATYKVDHELVRALLKAHAKPDIANHYGAAPLTEAAKLGDVDLVRMLLDARADPNSPNQDNQTALMLASNLGSLKIAQLLIGHGANVNAVENFRGQTALLWAAGESHPEIVDLLLAHHANVKLRAKYDDWPRQMTSEPRAQFRQTGGLTALLYATRSGCYRCAVAIVKAGADVNQPNPEGITPLINALDNRDYDIANFLLDKGANPGAWDMTGRTPLYVAVDMSSYSGPNGAGSGNFQGFGEGPPPPRPPNKANAMDLVNRLLAMGVDPNHELTRMRPNGNGRGRFADYMMRGGTGPLMLAALNYDKEAIKALLAHGADVDVPNVFQITPLMAAAGMSGSSRGGVGSAIVGGGSHRPVDVQARALETIDLLLDAGANINACVSDSHTHTAKLLAYVQGRDHEGQTALFASAESGWDRVVKHLIDRGADPTVHDAVGKFALDYARHPPPPGPGAPPAVSPAAAAARDATVALLTALTPKSAIGAATASTNP